MAVRPIGNAPAPLAGSAIDGSKAVHAAEVYRGSAASPSLPFIDKSRVHVLRFEGPTDDDGWVLKREGEPLQRYSTDDLRLSIVYRARCFREAL